MPVTIVNEQRSVRETTCIFEHESKGEMTQTEIRIRYFSWTTKAVKERRTAEKLRLKENPDEPVWYSDQLVELIESLPDLVDAKGKPHKITVAFLDSLDLKNLEAIQAAISEDLRPKVQPQT